MGALAGQVKGKTGAGSKPAPVVFIQAGVQKFTNRKGEGYGNDTRRKSLRRPPL